MPARGQVVMSSESAHSREARKRDEMVIHNMLKQYSQEHGKASLSNTTEFVVGSYGCPGQFGNRMHEFLNAFALAVITQRTFVWRYTNQASGVHEVGTLEECSKYVTRRDWIQSADVLPMFGAEIEEMNWGTNLDLYCVGVHRQLPRAIAPGKKLEQYQMAALALPGANVSPEMALRARRLMARGPEYLYGKLFEAAFHWTGNVVVPTLEMLQFNGLIDSQNRRTPPDALWVAVHIRHKDISDTTEMRSGMAARFADAISATVGNSSSRACAIFLATDDDMTMDLLKPMVHELGCPVVHSRMGKPQPDFKDEHGNNTGVGAMRDLFLLAHADTLVGTGFSSFSMAIAEHLRTNRGSASLLVRCLDSKRDIPCKAQDDIFEVDMPKGMCSKDRHQPKEFRRLGMNADEPAFDSLDQVIVNYRWHPKEPVL